MNEATGLLISALLAVTGSLAVFIYRELIRRLRNVERKGSATLLVLLLTIGRDGTIPADVMNSIKEAMADGK